MNLLVHLPNLNPIALSIGPLEIRWYSLAYIAGILFTTFWLKRCNKKENFMSDQAYEDWLTWGVLSILVGGRLGYVLFYGLPYFLSHPLEIFALWQGGMSFHGGLFGVIIGMWFFCKKHKISFLQLTDRLSVAAPVGLFFGRLANFVNMELYGRVVSPEFITKFGVIFPNAGDLPRHPSQLYEAFLEGIVLFLIMLSLFFLSKSSKKRGFLSGIFLFLYGIFRLFIENFREPDEQIGLLFNAITMGQALSFPLIFCGIFLVIFGKKTKKDLLKF